VAALRPEGHHQLTGRGHTPAGGAGVAPRVVTVAAARLPRWIDGFADRHGGFELAAGTAVVRLSGADGALAEIAVPFPPLRGDSARDLLEHVARPRRIGVLLVRRSGYAVGVFDGGRLVSSKVDSTYVQGTTKAGGWSQQRYARRRANQAAAAFAAAADTAARVLTAPLDALVCGGDRAAVRAVVDDPRLAWAAPLVTGPWLQVGDPKARVLQRTPEQFLAVRVTVTDPPAADRA
jgi:Actinobacteria/chloroflexi VLRF1 release factor